MRVFVTGATGFIGTAVVQELIHAGHQVLGLSRSDAGAKSLIDAGAKVHRGDLEDLESLRIGASMSEGVIHCAFIHDFSVYAASVETDRRAVEAIAGALEGSGKPLVIASGTLMVAHARPGTEQDVPASVDVPRAASEATGDCGVRPRRARQRPAAAANSTWRRRPWLRTDADRHRA